MLKRSDVTVYTVSIFKVGEEEEERGGYIKYY